MNIRAFIFMYIYILYILELAIAFLQIVLGISFYFPKLFPIERSLYSKFNNDKILITKKKVLKTFKTYYKYNYHNSYLTFMAKRPILKNLKSNFFILNKKDFLFVLIDNYSAFRSLFDFSYIFDLNQKYIFKNLELYRNKIYVNSNISLDNKIETNFMVGFGYCADFFLFGVDDLKSRTEKLKDLFYNYSTEMDEERLAFVEKKDDFEDFCYQTRLKKYAKRDKVISIVRRKINWNFRQSYRRKLYKLKLFSFFKQFYSLIFSKKKYFLAENLESVNNYKYLKFCEKSKNRGKFLKNLIYFNLLNRFHYDKVDKNELIFFERKSNLNNLSLIKNN